MATERTFRCQLITPERQVTDTRATQVVLTAHDGEVGVLCNRAALLSKLGIGQCRIDAQEGTQKYYIDGGFVQVLNNEMTVLTQRAIAVQDIDRAQAEQELEAARAREAKTLHEQENRMQDMLRATTMLRLASTG